MNRERQPAGSASLTMQICRAIIANAERKREAERRCRQRTPWPWAMTPVAGAAVVPDREREPG